MERTPPPTESLPSELNMSLYDRMKMFTDVRKDHPEWAGLSVKVGRGVLCRFDRTVQSFYKRRKEGQQARLPSLQALPAVALDGDTRRSAVHAGGTWNSQEPVGYLLEAPGEGSAPSAYP